MPYLGYVHRNTKKIAGIKGVQDHVLIRGIKDCKNSARKQMMIKELKRRINGGRIVLGSNVVLNPRKKVLYYADRPKSSASG